MVKLNKLPEPSIIEKNGGIEVKVIASKEDGNDGLAKGLVKELVKGLVKDLTANQIKLLELIESNPHVKMKKW